METKTASIDFSFLDGMLKLSKGDPRFVTESVKRFLKNCPEYLEDILKFRETRDREVLKQQSHKFVSSCSVVGAMKVIDICQNLSRKSDPEDDAMLLTWLENLEDEVKVVTKALNDYLTKIQAKAKKSA